MAENWDESWGDDTPTPTSEKKKKGKLIAPISEVIAENPELSDQK